MFEVPTGWERAEAEISGRRKLVVFASSKTPGANAFITYTPVKPDFTSLGSFGSLDEVSKNVLPDGPDVSSQMVEYYQKNNQYVYDYIVTQVGRPEKHIRVRATLSVC
ncbi:unnamed protein product [Choristocarpus tenellus]